MSIKGTQEKGTEPYLSQPSPLLLERSPKSLQSRTNFHRQSNSLTSLSSLYLVDFLFSKFLRGPVTSLPRDPWFFFASKTHIVPKREQGGGWGFPKHRGRHPPPPLSINLFFSFFSTKMCLRETLRPSCFVVTKLSVCCLFVFYPSLSRRRGPVSHVTKLTVPETVKPQRTCSHRVVKVTVDGCVD